MSHNPVPMVRNDTCDICRELRRLPHEREIASTHLWDTQWHLTDQFPIPTCSEEGLNPFWELQLYCHGRREQTQVVIEQFQLHSGAHRTPDGRPALAVRFVRGPADHRGQERRNMAFIVGCVSEHNYHERVREDLLVPYLATNMFLVFASSDGTLSAPEAPLVHLVSQWQDWRG